jgi:hypothetical protein
MRCSEPLSLVLPSVLLLLTFTPPFLSPAQRSAAPSCGADSPAPAGPRWHAPTAEHAILFSGRHSDFDFERMASVAAYFGGEEAADLFAVFNHGDEQRAAAEEVLAQFAALPNAVAAELVSEPPGGGFPPAALAAMPSFPFGVMDGPFVSTRAWAHIFNSLAVVWRLMVCAEESAGGRRYVMVVRARADLRVSEDQPTVDLSEYAAGRHGLEERLDGLPALEGIAHGDNMRTDLVAGQANPVDLGYSSLRRIPLFMPNAFNYGAYNDQLGFGSREGMAMYLNVMYAIEDTCGTAYGITFGPEGLLKGALILQAARLPAVIAVHRINLDYCINSGTNPCPGDVDPRCNDECKAAAVHLKTAVEVRGLP